jgi:hypothetical protein
MGMWTAIALISIAAICGETIRKKYQRDNDPELNGKLDSLKERLDALDNDLRDRVETLERIVTDSKEDLKRKFDYLDKAS